MLKVSDLTARYGTSQVLFGMDFEAARGECITLVGRNGMGKSTTVRSLLGMLRTHEGRVEFDGHAIAGWPSYRIAQAGIGLVPEMRQIFPTLTVRENLVATGRASKGTSTAWTLDRVYALFPRLRERERNLGTQLSAASSRCLRSAAR
jgi:branched-chain amino acid transport system ATP-binding protein